MTYFSLVTFSTVGFGDITPEAISVKIIVMMEIATSFFIIFFVIANYFNLKNLSQKDSEL